MRLELLVPIGPETAEGEIKRDVGAVVIRSTPTGGVRLDLGPADGPPHVRLLMSSTEATRLGAGLQAIAAGGGEEILITDK